MADEDKNKAKLDAKADAALADAPKPSDAKTAPDAKAPGTPVHAEFHPPGTPAPGTAPEAGKLAPADAHLIAQVAAQVANQMSVTAAKPASRVIGSDRTVKGGKYMVDGVAVNAWGEPYEEGKDGTLANPERRHF